MEFPRAELEELAMKLYQNTHWQGAYSLIHLSIKRYDQLAERCVMDATEASIEIANLRARLRAIDPEFPNG